MSSSFNLQPDLRADEGIDARCDVLGCGCIAFRVDPRRPNTCLCSHLANRHRLPEGVMACL